MRECVMKTHGARGVIESAKRERERGREWATLGGPRGAAHTHVSLASNHYLIDVFLQNRGPSAQAVSV